MLSLLSNEHIYTLHVESHKKLYQDSYYEFFKASWAVLEPENPLIDNWHIKYLCDLLQKEVERIYKREPKKKDLIINIPYRSLKSRIITVCLNAWTWTQYPSLKFITTSYSEEIAIEHTVDTRRLIESDWYQSFWSESFQFTKDQNEKRRYENTKRGFRKSAGVQGSITGAGCDILICDDPHNPKQAASDAERQKANVWWRNTVYSRLNNQTVGLKILVMQRLHEEDLTGNILLNNEQGYEHLCLPGELSDDIKPAELRENYKDGLFFPQSNNFSKHQLELAKKNLGEIMYNAQVLQRPFPAEGLMLKREWIQYYQEPPDKFDKIISSWDFANSNQVHQNNSFTVGSIWGKKGPDIYLLHLERFKEAFTVSRDRFYSMYQRFPECQEHLIEQKAAGTGIIDSLKALQVVGIRPITPKDSKEVRFESILYLFHSGHVFIPNIEVKSWVAEYVHELLAFNKGRFDDQVDVTSQAIQFLAKKNFVCV